MITQKMIPKLDTLYIMKIKKKILPFKFYERHERDLISLIKMYYYYL